MGLDITAYSHLSSVGKHTDDWCNLEDDHGDLMHIQAFAYDSFPESFRGLPILGPPRGRSGDLLDGGCYVRTDQTQTLGFHAGSYGGYGIWRRDLARQFNPRGAEQQRIPGTWGMVPLEPEIDKPFYEIIWFADNEGCIGPDAAADLLVDFREYAETYAPEGDGNYLGYYREKYRNWTRACELAAHGGLISFH